MKRNVVPDVLRPLSRDAVFDEKGTCRTGAFDLESMRTQSVLRQTEVMQYRREEHQLTVHLRPLLLGKEFGEPVTPHDVIEESVAGYAPREFLGLAGDIAVRRGDIGYHGDSLLLLWRSSDVK
ncbi:hypothetical protein ACFY0P_51185 [Streptomyces sp. NPDC001714]|uniref:hypothetical protein n=1 Tax=Streptomyces sp. NPDC001714 TaxID=3364603 RepID=UPI0036978F1B